MRKLRVMVVDDSAVVRSIVSRVLLSDPLVEGCDVAADGEIALRKIERSMPDAVVLDIEMPNLDGLETLAAIRRRHRELPVVIFSNHTERGAESTLTALLRGANDYVTKPTAGMGGPQAEHHIREELVPRLLALTHPQSAREVGLSGSVYPVAKTTQLAPHALVVGASTGGPNALADLLGSLPWPLPIPVAIVQHMPPLFTRALARHLSERIKIDVREAQDGIAADLADAWIAPGGYHLEYYREHATIRLRIHKAPARNSCRPSIDVLFESAAEVFGARILGIVLTGMGQDGVDGCRRIRDAGGAVLAQDEDSCAVWGIPRFVYEKGLAVECAAPAELARSIQARLNESVAPVRGES